MIKNEEILQRVAQLMREGLTQAEIAKEIGVEPRTIRRWQREYLGYKSVKKSKSEIWPEVTAQDLVNAGFKKSVVHAMIGALKIAEMQGNDRLHRYLSEYISASKKYNEATEAWRAMFAGLPILAEDIEAPSLKEITELAKTLCPYLHKDSRKDYHKTAKPIMMRVLADIQSFLQDAASAGGFPVVIHPYGDFSLFRLEGKPFRIDDSLIKGRISWGVPSEVAEKVDVRKVIDRTWSGVLFDIVSRLPDPDRKKGKLLGKVQLTSILYQWFSTSPNDFVPALNLIKRTPKDKLGHTIAGMYQEMAYPEDDQKSSEEDT